MQKEWSSEVMVVGRSSAIIEWRILNSPLATGGLHAKAGVPNIESRATHAENMHCASCENVPNRRKRPQFRQSPLRRQCSGPNLDIGIKAQ